MRLAYQYRLRLTKQQIATFENWLELCRRQYNYRLAERFNWYEQNRCDINRCSLEVCYLPQLKDKPSYYWYISLSLEDVNVPLLKTDVSPTPNNTVGIDMGLKLFLVTSDNQAVEIPQHYRKAEKRLKRLQRQLSRRNKGSKRRQKSIKRVAKSHLKVANQRKDFHYKTAIWLLNQSQVVAHENLNIKGLATSMLAKSVTDAGWGQFLQILNIKAASAGCLVVAVNPNGTSQECSDCGATVPKVLADRWHSCQCGASYNRDHNAARNIKHRAVGHPVLLQSSVNVRRVAGSR